MALFDNFFNQQNFNRPFSGQPFGAGQSVGTQAKSPFDNINATPNTLPGGQLKTQTPSSTQSTANGTYGYSPAYSSTGAPNFSFQSSSRGQAQTPAAQPRTPVITDVDNVNHTYMADGQKYALNPQTNRFELASNFQPTAPQNQPASNQPTTGTQNVPVPSVSQNQTPQGPQPYTPPVYSQNQGLYGQIATDLANRSRQSGADYQAAQAEAQRISDQQTALAQDYAQKSKNIQQTAGFLTQAQGEQGLLQNQYNTGQAALASQYQGATNRLSAANTQQGLLQQALQQAGDLAKPQLAGYNQQVFNPITGQFGGGESLQDAVSSIVQKVQNGTMSYNDATSALNGYGQGGINALQQALGPNFNVSQSNTLAAQQGSIGPAYSFAKTALTNLQNIIGKLGIAQGTNIPIINAIGNAFSSGTGIGSDVTRQYQGAVAEARNAYAQLLAASKGGTPTDYGSQSQAAIPDNATPNDIQAAIANLESLGKSKVNIYGNPGESKVNTQTTTLSGYKNGGAF